MKVLITGENGYIGHNTAIYLNERSIQCELASVREHIPGLYGYDAVIHAAAIVHVRERDPEKYYDVNTRLTEKLANEAKRQGVGQFIFLSSMAVYGLEGSFAPCTVTQDTPCRPRTHYGRSKAMAEGLLQGIETECFRVAIVRMPMVYGKNCNGNFERLKGLANRLPIFPKVNNQRSMLYIDNLCELLRLILVHRERGFYFPQNSEYVNTSALVRDMRALSGKKTQLSTVLGHFAEVIPLRAAKKIFGSLTYDRELSASFDNAYCVASYAESLKYSCNPLAKEL